MPAIKRLLEGHLPPGMEEGVKMYIYDYAYEAEDKASERFVDIVDSLM